MYHRTDVFFSTTLVRTPAIGIWRVDGILRDRRIGPLQTGIPEPFTPPFALADSSNEGYSASAITRMGPGDGVCFTTALGYRFSLPGDQPIRLGTGAMTQVSELRPGNVIRLKAGSADSRVGFKMRGYRLEPGFQALLGIMLARGRRNATTGCHTAVGIPERVFRYELRIFLERHATRILRTGAIGNGVFSFTITDATLNDMISVIFRDVSRGSIATMLLLLPLRHLRGILKPLLQLTMEDTRMHAPEWLCSDVAHTLLLRAGIVTRQESAGVLTMHRSAVELDSLLEAISMDPDTVSVEARNPALCGSINDDGRFSDHIASVLNMRGELLSFEGELPENCSFAAGLP